MKKNKKGFGVVEGFLAMTVFSMVGFVSLQGYSSEAKNAKVSSNLMTIYSTINTKMAEGSVLMGFVYENNNNRVVNLSLAGKKATKEDYFVGNPNYIVLGIKKNEFVDPSGKEYIVGATTTGRYRYEIAGVIEENGVKKSIIKGTYLPRTTKKYAITEIDGKKIVLSSIGTNAFYPGDLVKIGPRKYKIERVRRDGVTITLDKEILGPFLKIGLAENEGKSLIADYRDNTKFVIDGSTEALAY